MSRILPGLLLLLIATAAGADAHGPVRNLVSLAATAREDVPSDQLVVQLFAEHETRAQTGAGNAVNEDMAWALAAAGQVPAVAARTLDYRTEPVYDEQRVVGWRVRQSLRLTSTDHAALTALLGTLQERLAIESVGYEVSDAVRDNVVERLTTAAIERFRARAQRIAEAFGRPGYTLVNVNIDSHGPPPPPMPYAARMTAMKADMAPPAIEAGVQSIEVGINGTIELAAQ
jgi:predicted secreted protein